MAIVLSLADVLARSSMVCKNQLVWYESVRMVRVKRLFMAIRPRTWVLFV